MGNFDGDHDDVCGECRHGGELLLCGNCPAAFHRECLDPPLSKPPGGNWLCPVCVANGSADAANG